MLRVGASGCAKKQQGASLTCASAGWCACRGSTHPVLAYMLINKMPNMLPEVIKDCHKVLDKIEGIRKDDPQVVQLVEAIRQVRRVYQRTEQLSAGLRHDCLAVLHVGHPAWHVSMCRLHIIIMLRQGTADHTQARPLPCCPADGSVTVSNLCRRRRI